MPAARRKTVVSSYERLGGSTAAFTVRTLTLQNGSGFHVQPRMRFALEWCTPVSGFHGITSFVSSSCKYRHEHARSGRSLLPHAGLVLWDGAHEGFVEVLTQPTDGNSVFDADTDPAPLTLAMSSMEAVPAGTFSVAVRLFFYDTN
jgi:hypothetical protein